MEDTSGANRRVLVEEGNRRDDKQAVTVRRK
jgi:hypothetical protein